MGAREGRAQVLATSRLGGVRHREEGRERGRPPVPISRNSSCPQRPAPHPGCRSGGLGMGLLKPCLPTSQYVSSVPLPWEDTGKRT